MAKDPREVIKRLTQAVQKQNKENAALLKKLQGRSNALQSATRRSAN